MWADVIHGGNDLVWPCMACRPAARPARPTGTIVGGGFGSQAYKIHAVDGASQSTLPAVNPISLILEHNHHNIYHTSTFHNIFSVSDLQPNMAVFVFLENAVWPCSTVWSCCSVWLARKVHRCDMYTLKLAICDGCAEYGPPRVFMHSGPFPLTYTFNMQVIHLQLCHISLHPTYPLQKMIILGFIYSPVLG